MSYSINDELTKKTVRDFYEKYNKIIDPHGAVALAAYNKYIKKITKSKDQIAIIYETADPGKFSLEIQEILAFQPKLPKQLKSLKNKEELPNPQIIQDYEDFRNYLKTIAT
ncbi:MAG: Threonine synthase [Promethearchaeota archaeon]|nr:MAG: Threonine synthase [Candidatus Lokiarchaeota archaeon]